MLLDNEYFDDEEGYFDDEESPRVRSRFALIGLLIALTGIGSTFAASINLGSNQTEFGQGVLLASTCDSSITTKPASIFRNDSKTAGFAFAGVKLSGISEKCRDKLFIVNIYSETSSALYVNQDIPFKSLKFHFDNSGGVADQAGCLNIEDSVVNSAENNSMYASTKNCMWPDPNFNYHNSWANTVYRYTIQTRENTIRRIELTYTKNDSRTVGWVFDTGDEIHQSQFDQMTSYPIYPDLAKTEYFSLYLKLTNSEYASASSGMFTISSNNGSVCTYAGTVQSGDRSRAPGISSGNSQFQGVEYICKVSSNGILTIS